MPGSSKAPRKPCIAFVKYDGSNLRWEWSVKNGWHKFGTRKRLFDETDEEFGEAIPLFYRDYAEQIEEALHHRKFQKAYRGRTITIFTEFFGPNSFAGQHVAEDPKELRLFDLNVYKKGLLGPREFLDFFGHLDFSAEVVYEGNLNDSFILDVREGRYPGEEGVVAKGGSGHKLWMAKIKRLSYLKKLKEFFAGDAWKEFWE